MYRIITYFPGCTHYPPELTSPDGCRATGISGDAAEECCAGRAVHLRQLHNGVPRAVEDDYAHPLAILHDGRDEGAAALHHAIRVYAQ